MRDRYLTPRHTRRRDKVTIHLYALCWNEARMLPYFFRHYDPIVDQYFIADNGSTDGSLELLRRHRKVVVSRIARADSFIAMAAVHYNHCWKASRGIADWVFVINIDEHVYHRRLRGYLRASARRGVSVIVPEGYNMIASRFPTSSKPLWRTVPYGAREPIWDKPQIFNPTRIVEINFTPGRHAADPSGDVVYSRPTVAKLLHFKYLGIDYLVQRHVQLRSAIPAADLEQGWAYHYTWDRDRTVEEFERYRARAARVV